MKNLARKLTEFFKWRKRGFSAPSPSFVKRAVLRRHALENATWVETGTFLGETTAFLSLFAAKVYSLEPEAVLYERASKLLNNGNVSVINGASEDVFPDLLPKLKGSVCFWLDGHYSGDGTYKGSLDTPILKELECIERNIGNMDKVIVLIDDVRLFNGRMHSYGAYPSLDEMAAWAQRNNLSWEIEHDIFIAKSTA